MLRDITVSHRKEPLGLDESPKFSWKIQSDRQNVIQFAYRIIVSNGTESVWDSGKVVSEQSLYIEYAGNTLSPMTAYEATIIVWDNHNELHERKTVFETGLLSEANFRALWITHNLSTGETACAVFYKVVRMNGRAVKSARIYATACGVYEIAINDKKVSDSFFAPGWTSYKNRLQYQTYDVTVYLTSGENSISITVGNGWYKGYLNGEGKKEFYGDKVAILAMLRLEYHDGTVEFICTDDSWRVTTSVIRYAEIYHGETQDFTFKAQESENAVLFDKTGKTGKITAQESEPIRITKRIPAQKLIITPKGEVVIDFGQNMAGFVEILLRGIQSGTEKNKVILRHAETLDKDGNFYTENLRTAKAVDTYIYAENMVGKAVAPHFTYHGFRYICVDGIGNDLDISNFTACALHSDMEQIGKFACDNDKINRLQQNIEWSQRSNFFDIPTDCPQRDERLGWTGDAQIFCATGSFNFNIALFFQKWLKDVAAESDEIQGVPHVVPNIVGLSAGTAVWSDCATIIPWQMYESYGDKDALRENYPLMKLWVDYVRRQSEPNILWINSFQRGDWLALDAPSSRPGLMSGGTDKNLVANIYYAISTKNVRDAAGVLGFTEDENFYDILYNSIVSELNDEYVTNHGRLVSETQTACALLLHFRLLKEKHICQVIKTLEESLVNHKNHLTTGFVGTSCLCHALTESGKHILAEDVFLQTDYPGWFYEIEKGATTIWERWNSILPNGDFDESGMNSLNHYSFGAIGDWMYRKIAGINTLESGYKKILIRPILTYSMTEVVASLETMYGKISSGWKCRDGKITIDLQIPPNTTAILELPEKKDKISVGSGTYHFDYETKTSLGIGHFSKKTTFAEIFMDEKATAILYDVMPEMSMNPAIDFIKGKTVGEMEIISPENSQRLNELIKRLNTI